ncbi:hydroxycarboxylic acid receptor 2-like [Arapaima gigas]
MKSNSCCVFTENQFQLVLPPLLVLEFVVGVLGNSLALWIFSFHMKPWKSSTVLLFNLALADFLLTVPLPFRAAYYQRGRDWMYGDAFCRVCIFMLAMNRGGSILFMMAVAVDRYLRVVLPHHPLNSMSVFKAMGVAGAIWALAISLTAHLLFWSHLHQANNKTQCDSFIICNNTNFSYYWHKGGSLLLHSHTQKIIPDSQ